MANDPIFLYVATYDSEADARDDYDAVRELHREGVVGTYDAALITRDDEGKVRIHRHELPTVHGAWAGAAAGAVVGIFVPPFLLVDAALGALAGGVIGHVREGLPRRDLTEIGSMLNDSTSAIVVVGQSKLQEAMQKALKRATKQVEKEINADAKQFDRDLEASVRQSTAGM